MNSEIEHLTAHAYDGLQFVGGCTCGEVFERRATLQATIADEIGHRRPQIRLLIPPCTEPECPVCSNHG